MPQQPFRQPRTLSEQEFEAIKARVMESAPEGLDEPSFMRWVGPRMEQAVAEAEYRPQTFLESAGEQAKGFGKEYLSSLNPMPMIQALSESHFNPMELAAKMGQASGEEAGNAGRLFRSGDNPGAARSALRAVPLAGPIADHALALAEKGEWGRLAGALAALATPGAINKYMPRGVNLGGRLAGAGGKTGQAVRWWQAEGIPMDLATVTDNPVVRAGQHLVERATLGGMTVTPELQAQQSAALAGKARQLAGEASPGVGPQTNVSAGEAVASELNRAVAGKGTVADAAYGRVRGQLGQTAPTPVPVKGASVDMVAPVDLAPLKSTIQALSDDMTLWSATRQQASPAFSAVRNILAGPDVVPLEQAEKLLGALKELARGRRGASGQGLATTSEGLAIHASKKLQAQVNAAASQAGVLNDLNAGRTATREQHMLDRVRRDVTGKPAGEPVEPGSIFNRLTSDHDLTINRLNSALTAAPASKPIIARAVLEDLFAPSLKGDGFARELSLSNNWNALGPRMKIKLFGPDLTERVTQFVRLAEQVNKNANPSGSGHVAILGGTLASAAGGVGAMLQGAPGAMLGFALTEIATVGIAKALRNPAVINAITKGLQASVPVRGTARAAATAGVLKPGIVPAPSMSQVPMLAGEQKER